MNSPQDRSQDGRQSHPLSRPLSGIRVLDFSTLLPGPMCTLLLAEAGAEIIKIERPGQGDEMRTYAPSFGSDSVNFGLLNRSKRSIVLDLKQASGREQAIELVRDADVLVEQFRAGVMQRLGLGYETLSAIRPGLIYCSISGFGQDGPLAQVAAHDLNYLAESGMLSLTAGHDGAPGLPPALIADLAGGAYPAMMNILLALRQRDSTGHGCHLDIAMADHLFPLMYWGLGNGFSSGHWPTPGSDLVTGASPRYQVYRTLDGQYLACAPLEQKFWIQFLDCIGAPELHDDATDPEATLKAIAAIIANRAQADWLIQFEGRDVCVAPVRSLEEAVKHPHFQHRGLFSAKLDDGSGRQIPALPVPIDRQFRGDVLTQGYPSLGEGQNLLESS